MFGLDFLHHIIIGLFAAILIMAALSDGRRLLIPNQLPLSLLILYPAYLLTGGEWHGGLDLLVGLAAFIGCFGFFVGGVMGGGDVKLFSVVALWAGTRYGVDLILATSLIGGAMALVLASPYGIWVPVPMVRSRMFGAAPRPAVPYGIAIAGAGLLVAWQMLHH